MPLLNDPELTRAAADAAKEQSSHVNAQAEAMTASEDFARFLDLVPGCFLFVGNGEDS